MSPRPYRNDVRRATAEQTRARIVAAARELLAAEPAANGFSLDAVARKAGVVRMTVYYQFGSKSGLLEAIYDDIGLRGGIAHLHEAFALEDPWQALRALVEIFAAMYESARPVIKRLNALAMLDEDVERSLRARVDRRRASVVTIVERLVAGGTALALGPDDARAVLLMLTSFETFDTLAGEGRSLMSVLPLVERLAETALRAGSGPVVL